MYYVAAESPERRENQNSDVFSAFQDRKQVVEERIARALESDLKLFLVLGADWGHGFQSLARLLQSNAKEAMEQHYEVAVLDAGWLNNLYDLLVEFNHPAYFGTPSLLVIDPASYHVLHRDTVQRWQSAHSESGASMAHYLSQFASYSSQKEQHLISYFRAHAKSFNPIQHLEREQAARVYKVYGKPGPELALKWQGDEKVELDDPWYEVRRFRYQLQHNLVLLYQSLESKQLVLAKYNRFHLNIGSKL